MSGEQIANKSGTTTEKFIWLKATYHFHVFHYRMPQSAAIAAVTPFVPSPLTVKMAMIASLFQLGDVNGAKIVAKNMHKIEVKIAPPKAALSFKAFLRYRSSPAVDSEKGLDETGSYYPSRPHMREYAIFQDNLEIYIKVFENLKTQFKKALKNMRYLGSKDSLITCFDISEVDNPPQKENCVNKLNEKFPGIVVLLADFKSDIQISDIKQLIPGKRKGNMYEMAPYTISGKIRTKGKSKIFISNRFFT